MLESNVVYLDLNNTKTHRLCKNIKKKPALPISSLQKYFVNPENCCSGSGQKIWKVYQNIFRKSGINWILLLSLFLYDSIAFFVKLIM